MFGVRVKPVKLPSFEDHSGRMRIKLLIAGRGAPSIQGLQYSLKSAA